MNPVQSLSVRDDTWLNSGGGNPSPTTGHKLVYLVSTPRSLSTVFLRMMQSRKDFAVYNEPSALAYYYKTGTPEMAQWFIPEAPKDFDKVKGCFFDALQKSHVFAKEMSFVAHQFLLNDPEFVQNPKVHFVFLTRHPRDGFLSFYKKIGMLPPNVDKLIGLDVINEVFDYVVKKSPNPVMKFSAEDLYQNSKQVVQGFCNQLGISYLKESMRWEAMNIEEAYKEWHEIKVPIQVKHWHDGALASLGFNEPPSYSVDDRGEPTFIEVKKDADREALKELYLKNSPYYEKLTKQV